MVVPTHQSTMVLPTIDFPLRTGETVFDSSLSSTVSLDENRSSQKQETQLRRQSYSRKVHQSVRFEDVVVVIRHRTDDEDLNEAWYSVDDMDRFLQQTVELAMEVGEKNSELVKYGWEMYDLCCHDYVDEEILGSVLEGLWIVYSELDDVVGLESILFDSQNDGKQRTQGILRALSGSLYADADIHARLSRSFSRYSRRWAQLIAQARSIV